MYFTIASGVFCIARWCILPDDLFYHCQIYFTIARCVFYHCWWCVYQCRCCALPMPNDVAVACFTNARWYVLLMPDGVAAPPFPLFGFYLLLDPVAVCINIWACFTNPWWYVLQMPDGMFYHYRWCIFTSARWCFIIADGALYQCQTMWQWHVLPMPDGMFYRCQMMFFYQCQMVCFTNDRWCVLPVPDHISLHLWVVVAVGRSPVSADLLSEQLDPRHAGRAVPGILPQRPAALLALRLPRRQTGTLRWPCEMV